MIADSSRIQARLLALAGAFLFLFAVILTLSPAALARTWQVQFRWDHWLGWLAWLLVFGLTHLVSSRRLPERDPYLLPLAALLSGWGLLTIWRLAPSFGLRQAVWLLLCGGALVAGIYLPGDLGFLRRYKYVWLTGGLLLTALTLFLGTNPLGQGPRMWLGCCGIYFQPSEPLKLLLIVYLSAYLAGMRPAGGVQAAAPSRLLPLLAPTLVMAGLALALLLAQRDLGTATIFVFIYTVVIYIASGNWKIAAAGGLGVIAAGAAGYILFDVVRLRVDAWLNPWVDPSGRSYQIVQSLLAVANGGLFGRGPGIGSPGLVPVAHSDFIFAAIAEETGLTGALGMLLAFAVLASRGARLALRAADPYRRILGAGLTAHLVIQGVVIIGGNLRLLPLTGVTLPFVSYGGSSLLTSFLSLVLLLQISQSAEGPAPELAHYDHRRFFHLHGFMLASLAAGALAAGWWAFYRGPALLLRTDNPRRVIADRYVPRGRLLDRNNQPIVITQGEPAAYTRQALYPPLSVVLGYSNPTYGLAGLEQSLDDYLRGLSGYPGLTLWWNHLLFGQPPPGLDVRLSLDLNLQRLADAALQGKTGALVLLNAQTGEVLAMASHPGFDANQLEQEWETLVQDPGAPFLNRAVLGFYPAAGLAAQLFPEPDAAAALAAVPHIRLPEGETLAAEAPTSFTPLQIALGAAALTQGGQAPAATLVQAVNTPLGGWVLLSPLDAPAQYISSAAAASRRSGLAASGQPYWEYSRLESAASASPLAWYVAGTLPDWAGIPFSLALALEDSPQSQAEETGRTFLQAVLFP